MTTNIFDSTKPVFTYFDLYGRGEAIRMALVHSKTNFEDNRVGGESWAAFKASGKCNNGQVPVLEVNGQALNQSEVRITEALLHRGRSKPAFCGFLRALKRARTRERCLVCLQAIIRFVGSQVGSYDTTDPFAMWAADAVINTCGDYEKSAPKTAEGKPMLYSMFGDDPISEESVASMVEHRGTMWAALQVMRPLSNWLSPVPALLICLSV